MNLLEFQLGILLIVLRESVLDGLLQLVLDVATHVAHLYLGLLCNLGTLLSKIATTLLSRNGDVQADHLTIVLWGNAPPYGPKA